MKTIHQISTEEERAKKNSGKVRNKFKEVATKVFLSGGDLMAADDTLLSSRMKHPWSWSKCRYHTGRKHRHSAERQNL